MVMASKILNTIDMPCHEIIHPWVTSCCNASTGLLIHSIQTSLRIYVTTYTLTLLMKGRKPTKKELKQTLLNILQSTAFLSCHSFGLLSAMCLLRRLFGKFNVLSVAFLPCSLSSLVAILIERPSRRGLLSLYVTNVASETFYNMMVNRGIIKPIRYGDLFIFGSSITLLLYFFRGQHNKTDSIYSLLRFVVGSSEENNYKKPLLSPQTHQSGKSNQGIIRQAITDIYQAYCTIDSELKTIWTSDLCPHTYGCLYYILSIVSCLMRRFLGKDSKYICIPAGLLASLTYCVYRNNSITLYVMLKTLQIMYIKGSNDGHFPDLPRANIFFYCFSTAILIHAAILEPHNLRPSYWKFLQSLSGETVGLIDRNYLDIFGLKSSESFKSVLKTYKPVPSRVFKFKSNIIS
ncbi:PREDICTED: transmembrane protein 135-like isoform X2 [Diuraphis noxia]|uniref:transmembrane protein 135-like isoform X2 n=1 Tax=Diuraphis noxia TaxID=143948 RepID=UPI0007638310|nr:PREDICTED: transmembrane protein 135-like isoform X2 [Diuraphis noxia]